MEDLCVLQDSYLSSITKTLINFKKTSKSRLSANYIKIRLENLEQYWQCFVSTHKDILKKSTSMQRESHVYFTEDIFSKGEEEYIIVKCELSEALQKMEPLPTTLQASNLNNSEKNNQQEIVKLPKINIPHFSGNYNDWNTFHDLYTSLIHGNQTLSNIQKMHYLKTCLTGEAEHLLQHISITDKNYAVAWETLKERYNNRRVIINTILNRLLSQKKINNCIG